MRKEGRSIIIMLSINVARPKHVVVLVLRICALSYSYHTGKFMLAVGNASAFASLQNAVRLIARAPAIQTTAQVADHSAQHDRLLSSRLDERPEPNFQRQHA